MGVVRKLKLALAAATCAALLASCGDDDSTSSPATDATSAESTVTDGGAPGAQGKGDGEEEGSKGEGGKDGSGSGSGPGGSGDDGDGSGEGGSGGNGSGDDGGPGNGAGGVGSGGAIDFTGPPTRHKHPEPVEGERSAAFRVAGGDNSIQEYGEEEDAEGRAEAMKPIIALYRALETGNWSSVCDDHLSAPNLQQLKVLAEKSSQIKGKGCAEILGGLNQTAGGARGPDTPDGEIVSFRVEGDTGFAIWWGIDGKGYALALKSEDGAWKLTALAPTPLHFGG